MVRRLAGELAMDAAAVKGPATVRVGLIDQLFLMTEADIKRGVRILWDDSLVPQAAPTTR
jgi:hydroxyethylthiazole kinase-like sugar kinase family protein